MEITNPDISSYSEKFTSPESSLLQKINRDTHAEVRLPRMLSGHLQGRMLAIISKMLRPRTILEIGTYTGYSALCFAEGLVEGGKVITLDNNPELETRVRKYFEASGVKEKVDFRVGDARKIIPELPGPFNLVFIDADKESYAQYFDLVIDKVPPGGVILADNVLWSGKVLEAKPDKDTKAIMEFNKKVMEDERVENVLLPVRDGVMVMMKK